jgi:hypothetical protein
MTKNIIAPRIRPGMATRPNTQRHVTKLSNCVAMMGESANPNSAKPLCCRPRFSPRRRGRDASAVAAKLVGQNEPSATPIRPRMAMRLKSPPARPEKPESSEKAMIAGMRTFRRPILSEMPPIRAANTPQDRPSTPMQFPTSCAVRPRSFIIEGNSGAMSQRSKPTSPNPSASSVTAFHS